MYVDPGERNRTPELLREVSNHLSTNPRCKGQVYYLRVEPDGVIRFSPDIWVLPNRYKRKEQDKEPVVEHILKHHFGFSVVREDDGSIKTDSRYFVPGNYQYVPWPRRRIWTNIPY